MKQEVVLPKFKIPGQTNWLVRGLWIGAALVVVLAGVVVFGLSKQKQEQALQAQKLQAEQAAAAAAAAATPAPAAKAPRAAAGRTLATKAPTPLGAAALDSGKGGVAKPRGGLAGKAKYKKARARAGYTFRKARAGQLKPGRQSKMYVGKAGARATKPAAKPAAKAKPGAKGGDAIDDILRNFK